MIVGGEHHRAPAHHARQQVGAVRVETRVRLVEDQEARTVQNRTSDRKPLLLTAREPSCRPPRDVAEPNQGQRLRHALAVDVVQRAEEFEILRRRKCGVQPRRMGDIADLRPKRPALTHCVEPEDRKLAGSRTGRGGEDAKQRGLAGAVVPQDRKVLSLVERKVDGVEGNVRTEPLSDLVGDDRAHFVFSVIAGAGSSAGVLISGHSTNGPDANNSSVATISAI